MDKNLFENIKTKAVLVALITDGEDINTEKSLQELEKLLETAGGEAVLTVTQGRSSPDTRTYIGKGKAEEIADYIKNNPEVNIVVFDNELSPSQIANLEDALDVKVIDRTMLILDIFALHAVSGEGKLQVEIACLRYVAPRLIGKGKELSRLAGGIGTRGPGESKLESDRRHIKRRIHALAEQIEELEKNRGVQHAARQKNGMKSAAIVGYTNAGKSTLLNRLTDAGVLVEDKLFATLDPTTRRLTLPDRQEILLTDTVGFIDRLPTHLVKAFKSTLDELKYADIIICVTDAGEPDEERRRKRKVTEDLIHELGASGKPLIEVYNKSDIETDSDFIPSDAIKISALDGSGIDVFLEKLNETVNAGKKKLRLLIPHDKYSELNLLYKTAVIHSREDTEQGAVVIAECDEKTASKFAVYIH